MVVSADDETIRTMVRDYIAAFDPARGMPTTLSIGGPEDDLIAAAVPTGWQQEKDEIFAGMDAYAVKGLGMELWTEIPDVDGSLRSRLRSITCPTTVLVGEHDHPLVDQAPALAAEVADGRLTVIDGRVPLAAADTPRGMAARGRGPPRRGRRPGAMSETAAPQASDRIPLAGSDVTIPPLGVGTWAWGDKGTWGMGGYDASLTESTIHDAWEASIEAGVVLFDTAEVYGKGESERIIGRLLAAEPSAATAS